MMDRLVSTAPALGESGLQFGMKIGLPLLMKELREQSARRRTYVVRACYAVLLLLGAYLFYRDFAARYRGSYFAMLGQGDELFNMLVGIQFAGIYLFLPALAAGVITAEKERNTFGTLLLTRLSPWTILFEKYLSRILPMFGMLLISLPPMAVAFALGGISTQEIHRAVWGLGLTILQVGAWSLFCSAYFRTTVSSLVACYLLGVVVLFGFPFAIFALEGEVFLHHLANVLDVNNEIDVDHIRFCTFAPVLTFDPISDDVLHLLFSLPLVGSIVSFLVLARWCIVRRAFVQPTNVVLRSFRSLDRVFQRLNENRLTRGIILWRDGVDVAVSDPVAWRETTKSALGSFRYLVRLWLVLQCVVISIGVLSVMDGRGGPLMGLTFALWILNTLILAVKGASLITAERARETLDVLLTTPLQSRRIVSEKMQGVWRLGLVLAIPLLTLGGLKMWWLIAAEDRRSSLAIMYGLSTLLTICCYFPMICYLSLVVGLSIRTQSRAVIGVLAVIFGWCVLPLMFSGIVTLDRDNGERLSMLLSPATIIFLNEELRWRFLMPRDMQGNSLSVVLINAAWYAGVTVVLRWLGRQELDRRLGRLG